MTELLRTLALLAGLAAFLLLSAGVGWAAFALV